MSALVALLLALLVPLLRTVCNYPNASVFEVRCASNLRQIGLACMMYANIHGGQWPGQLSDTLQMEDVTPDLFCCPASTDTTVQGQPLQVDAHGLTTSRHLSYHYLGKGLRNPVPLNVVIAYEDPFNHGTRGMHIVFSDGRVDLLEPADAQHFIKAAESVRGYATWPLTLK